LVVCAGVQAKDRVSRVMAVRPRDGGRLMVGLSLMFDYYELLLLILFD
jgi:hypothetical protein